MIQSKAHNRTSGIFMVETFNTYSKVSHSEMDDLAISIMEELFEEDEVVQREQMMRLMSSAKISVQSLCPSGKTLGFYLAREMSEAVLKTYHNLGGDLTVVDNQGNTLLFEALSGFPVFLGNDYDVSCIDMLLRHGLDINHTNAVGQTPIFGICENLNHSDVRHMFARESHKPGFEDRVHEYIALLETAQGKGADLRHVCKKGLQVFDAAQTPEFGVLHQNLAVFRAKLEKETLLENIPLPTVGVARKM